MFKRCVGSILLIAFIRLQLACCCGSIVCIESSPATSEHSCHEHSCHDHQDIDSSAEGTSVLAIKYQQSVQPGKLQISSECRCCYDGDNHRHTLYMLKHGLITPTSKLTLDSLVVVQVFPVDMIAYAAEDHLIIPSQTKSSPRPFLNFGILETLGQLRI